MAFERNNATCITDCNAYVDLLDGGQFRIYSGAIPTDCETAASGTLLATITFGTPAFGAAADQAPNAQATANATTPESSPTGGTAGYWRLYTSGGTCIGQGLPADLTFNTTTVPSSGTVSFSSALTYTVPE